MIWGRGASASDGAANSFSVAGRRALVLGLGVHSGGVGVASYLARSGASVIVTDLQPPERLAHSVAALEGYDISFTLGRHDDADLDRVDLVIRNPGVPRESGFVQAAEARGIPVLMEMSLFLAACPTERVVGITGTKGKTTTTTLTVSGLWVAVLADTGATALVTLNALRLLRFKGAQSVDDDRDTGHPTRSPQPQAAH